MSERLNIKNMLIEPESTPETRFNPYRDITDEQREKMKGLREAAWLRVDSLELVALAAQEKILGSDVILDSKEKERVNNFLKIEAREDIEDLAAVAGYLKIINDPDMPVSLSDQDREAIKNFSLACARNGETIKRWKMVFYEYILGMPVKLSKDEKASLGAGYVLSTEDSRRVAFQRLFLKESPPTDDDFKDISEYRKMYAEKELWLDWESSAFYEAITSADKVTVPPGGGLQLIFGKSPQASEQTPSLPSQRNF